MEVIQTEFGDVVFEDVVQKKTRARKQVVKCIVCDFKFAVDPDEPVRCKKCGEVLR